MKIKRFKMIRMVDRDEFFYWKSQNNFNQRRYIVMTKIYLWEKSLLDVEYYKNKNIISKLWNGYYEKKDLITNYTYLDIDIEFHEILNFARLMTCVFMEKIKRDGYMNLIEKQIDK